MSFTNKHFPSYCILMTTKSLLHLEILFCDYLILKREEIKAGTLENIKDNFDLGNEK